MLSHYVCQRCKLPLVVDDSLQDLSNAQTNLLIDSKHLDETSRETPVIPRERLQLFYEASGHNVKPEEGSFVILNDKKKTRSSSMDKLEFSDSNDVISDRVSMLDRIFNVLSSNHEIDFPVCGDCANLLTDGLRAKYDLASEEKDTYVQFLKKLTNQSGPNIAKAETSLKEIEQLERKQEEQVRQYDELQREKTQLEKELGEAEAEVEHLKEEEFEFCKTKNRYESELGEFLNERAKVKSQYEYSLNQLDALRKANVYNDAFTISHDGQFGTINGLRLGTADNCKISCHETNAALGQLVLLLATVTTRLGIKLPNYVLRPMGSTSKIDRLEPDPKDSTKQRVVTLDCFSNGANSFASLFSQNKLDHGLVAIVDIVAQIGERLKQIDESIILPYAMSKDRIAKCSIRPSAKASNEEWTNACRYLLTNTKWILAYASAHQSK